MGILAWKKKIIKFTRTARKEPVTDRLFLYIKINQLDGKEVVINTFIYENYENSVRKLVDMKKKWCYYDNEYKYKCAYKYAMC